MHATTIECTLLRFCELLNSGSESCGPDDLGDALAAVKAAVHRGERDTADLMCRAISAVTGIRATVAPPPTHGLRADVIESQHESGATNGTAPSSRQ